MKAVGDLGDAALSPSAAFLTAWGHLGQRKMDSGFHWRASASLHLPSNKNKKDLHLRGEPALAVRFRAAVSYACLIPESCAHTLVKSQHLQVFFSALFRGVLIVTVLLGLLPSLLPLIFPSSSERKPWRPHCAGSCSFADSRDFGLRTLTATTRRGGSTAGGGTRSCHPTSYRKMASVSSQWFDLIVRDE